MTYFIHPTAAERYAQSRPYFHPLVIDKIRTFLELQQPLRSALDVACGTGQSSVALKAVANRVIGIDRAREMLNLAPVDPAIQYVEAPAEAIPLRDETVDLVTVSLAFHWLDRERFLGEAHRVLRLSRWLIIYNNGFMAQMKENPAFADWHNSCYLARYPVPPRNEQAFTDRDAQHFGFRFINHATYTNEVTFSLDELVRYLMTQSNVIAMVEQGAQTIESVYAWLTQSLSPCFATPRGTFVFGGDIRYLQKVG